MTLLTRSTLGSYLSLALDTSRGVLPGRSPTQQLKKLPYYKYVAYDPPIHEDTSHHMPLGYYLVPPVE